MIFYYKIILITHKFNKIISHLILKILIKLKLNNEKQENKNNDVK